MALAIRWGRCALVHKPYRASRRDISCRPCRQFHQVLQLVDSDQLIVNLPSLPVVSSFASTGANAPLQLSQMGQLFQMEQLKFSFQNLKADILPGVTRHTY